jgi:hypothetical protein
MPIVCLITKVSGNWQSLGCLSLELRDERIETSEFTDVLQPWHRRQKAVPENGFNWYPITPFAFNFHQHVETSSNS